MQESQESEDRSRKKAYFGLRTSDFHQQFAPKNNLYNK